MERTVPDSAPTGDLGVRKRRSTRVVQAVPLTVSGVDAAGGQFQERTSTLFVSCHGCLYKSTHLVLKNAQVTLEIPHPVHGKAPRRVLARVAGIQRPRTPNDLFQISVELENPGNVWGLAFPPPDWSEYQDSDAAESVAPPAGKPARSAGAPRPTPITSIAEDNLRVLPSAESDDSPGERNTPPLIVEIGQQVQTLVHEAVSKAVAEQLQANLVSFDVKLKQAVEESLRAAANSHSEQANQHLAAALQAARQSSAGFQEEWKRVSERQRQDAARELISHLTEVGESQRVTFEEGFKAILDHALGRLGKLDAEIDESAEDASRRCQESIADRAKGQVAEAGEHLKSLLEADIGSMQAGWREGLDGDLAAAQERWDERMTSSLQAAGRKAAEQAEAQAQLAAKRMTDELESRGAKLHAKLEQATADAENHLATLGKGIEGETSRVRAELDELQSAIGTRVEESADRLDALSKTATDELKWYEKKLQSQLQTSFERELEQASNGLREKAAEISGLFASQLEHFSRGYVEHTQVQLDDTAKGAIEKSRRVLAEASEHATAEFGSEIRGIVDSELERLSRSVSSTLERAIKEHTPKVRAAIEADAKKYLAEFRASLGDEARISRGAADDEAVEAYKKRLEDTSASWRVTTVDMLERQSKDLITALAHDFEERIRATCTDVLNSFREIVGRRMQTLSTKASGNSPSSEKK
jgi:hypothetical protein